MEIKVIKVNPTQVDHAYTHVCSKFREYDHGTPRILMRMIMVLQIHCM